MAQTIKIGVEFFDAQESAKALLDQLRKEAGRFKAGTTISDALVGDIKSLEGIIKKLDSSLAKGFNSHSDVNKVVNDFNQITRIYEHVASTIEKTKFQDLNLNFDDFSHLAKDLSQATAELAKFKSQKEKIEQTTVQDLLGKTSKNLSLFSTDQLSTSSTTIWSKLTQDLEKYKNSLSDAQQKTQALQNTYNAATKAANTGNQVYKRDNDILSLIGESPKNQADMKTIRGSFIQDIQASLKLDDNKMNLSKAFSATQKKTLEEWLAPLGLSADSVQNIIATGKSRAEALSEELAKLPYKDIPKVRKAVKASLAQRTLDNEVAKAKRDYESSEKKRAAKEQTVIETEARIKALETPLQQKDYLSTGSNTTLDQKIGNLLSRVQALETQLRQKASSGLNAGANGGGNIPSVSGEPYHNALNQQAETADLERQGRAMIQRWIGTEAIVNKVRNGIRQAYQDIKSLDAAMTNIAVVTDMSIGDLWGKIDSYMSIAKQYGVTTQGVYEVSQLYYQQGLSTSEVMAATSETLKMARIAGMDYAEAADAMTVAIRAFKMEMSDAQIVTDVYSKVAAITASDSEELAIAMSKTASSAASVGSSFENTTAMLAVMVETTRESAQNLGSALKSIISRYGEMKTGVTVDADGEAIDYNKVDTALQSIGIALKDTQGQFRDFDDVIFELSEKWDTLDKNTQRYIATIMAGNRQQSRFIALVDNWERLDEVATAAQDSEDAGLLQYAKTLDSLETKLNNIKTSFQEFYMSIINGPVIGKVFETINSLFEGFNKQGSFAALLDVGSIVSSLTIIGNMFVSIFSGAFGQISANWKAMLQGLPADAAIAGQKAGNQYRNGATQSKGIGKLGTGLATAASFAGLALTTAGAATTQKYHNNIGAGMSAVGNALSYGSMGFMLSGGNPIATAVAAILGGITSGVAAWRSDFELEQAKLQDLQKQAEDKNIERAEAKNEYSNLKALLDSYQKAEQNKNISEETYQQWLDINNQITEAYPALLDYIDAEGNAIADVTSATEMLDAAFQKMTTTTWDYYQAKKAEVQQEIVTNQSKEYSIGWDWSHKDAFTSGYSKEDYSKARADLYQKYFSPYDDVQLQDAIFKYRAKAGTTLAWNPGQYQELLKKDPGIALLAKAGLIDTNNRGYFIQDIGKNFNINELNQRLANRTFQKMSSKQVVDTFGADYIQQTLIDYNNSVYDKTIQLSEETKGAITLFADLGVFQGDAGEIFSLDEAVKNYINQAKLLQELDSLASEAHLSLITGLLGENNKNVKDIDGYTKLVLSYVEMVGGFTGDEINSTNLRNTDEQGKTILDKANDAFNEVQQILANQPALLDIFNSFYSNLGNLSFEEVNFQLESFGIQDNKEEKDLYDIYTQRWYALQYRNFARWTTSLTDQQIIPYETWLENQQEEGEEAVKDSEAMRAEYAKQVLAQLRSDENDSWLAELITNNTTTTIDSLASLSNSLNKIIEESSEDSITYKTTTQQKELLDKVKDSNKIQQAFEGLPNPQEIEEEFYSLFLTDFGTSEWGEKLQAFAQKYKVDLAELLDFDTDTGESLDDYIFENFDIQVKAASESIDTIRKTWDDLAEKQKKGFTQKEADNLVQQLNKVSGNTDKAFEDYFNVSNDGIITLSDFNNALTTLVSDDTQKIDKLRESANAELAKIKASGGTNIIQTSKNVVDNERKLIALGLTDDELIQTLANQMTTEDIGTDFNVTEKVENYVNQLNNFVKILENYKASIAAEATRQSKINALYGGEEQRKRVQAEKTIASRGAYGYTGEEVQNLIEEYEGLDADDFKLQADGTFDLVNAYETLKALNVDQYVLNAVRASIEATTKSAEEGLQQLGETAATGEKLTPVEIRNLLGDQFKGISDAGAKTIYESFMGYLSGSVDEKSLLKELSAMHRFLDPTLSYEDSLIKAKETFEEIYPEISDAADKNIADLFELKGKALRGELTETERRTLTEKGIDPQVIKDLENRTQEAISNYVNEIISNTELDFDAKVSTLKKDVFTPKLKEKFGEDIRGLAETAVKGSFNTQEAAADFLSQFYVAMGGAISNTKLDDWIEEGTTGYTLDYEAMSEAIEARKAEINNQSNLTASNYEVQKALNDEWDRLNSFQDDLNYYSSIQAQQRKESLYPALQSMAADKTITASQLMDLFKNQNKEITLEEAQTYQQELETLSPLARLKKLREYLEKKEVTIDESEYKEIVKETYASVMSSVSGAIGKLGSGMSWDDTFVLIEEVEGLDFEDFDLINGQYFVKNISKVTDHYLNQLKEIYGNEIPANVQEEAQAAIEQLKKQAEKDLEIAKYAAQWGEALEEDGIEQTKTEGLDLLKSKGYKGYTAQDMATLQAAGLIKTDAASLEKIQSQIDEETGAFYLTPEDLQPVTAATRNALKLTLDQEVQSAKTAAENLATKMASGTAEFGDYEALFKESITPENFDIVEPLLNQYVEDQSNAADVKNALKRAYPGMEEENIDAILANWVAFYTDAKHDTARSIFDTKIDALNNRYLSEAAKKTLTDNDAEDFVEKLTDLAKKSANDIFNLVYEEYNKALDAGTINREEYRSGLAEQASKAFTAKAEEKYADLYINQATEEIASGDALYDTDALGALYASIADKEKQANKNAEYKFEDFYNDFVTGITESGEAILDVKKLKAQNYISDRRYKEYSSALVDNLFSSAENIITQFKTGDTAGLDLQIQQMFDSLGMALSSEDAEAIVKGGEQVLLNRLIFEIGRAGLDTTEVQSRLEELQALILDTIIESISSGMSALGEGIKGTLSEASFLDLQKRYGFKDSSFRTSRGVQLSAQNLQDVITGLYGDAKTNGRTAGFGKQLLEVLNTEGSGIEGYKDIEKAIADANEQVANGVKGAEEYAEALMLARDAAYEMADAAEFAFMEQDGYDGKADTFDKFIENVTKAKEALGAFKKGGKVAYTDLAMMFDVIKSGSKESITQFETSLSKAGGNMEEILHSMLDFIDTTGKIDLGKWATKMGIDIETATSAMAEGMSDALMATAKDQIKYLSGLEAMLMAMIALEEVGNIKLNFELDLDGDGKEESLYLKDVYEAWKLLDDTSDRKDLIAEIEVALGENTSLNAFLESMGIKGANFFELMFPNGIDPDDEFTFQTVAMLGQAMSAMKQLAPEQADTVSKGLFEAFEKSLVYDEATQKWSFGPGWQQSLRDYLGTLDWSNVAYSASTEIAAQLAESGQDSFIIDGVKVTLKNGKYYIPENSTLTEKGVQETLEKRFGITGGKAVEVEGPVVDGQVEVDFVVDPNTQSETETLKTEFTSISEAATGVSDAINKLQTLLSSFQISDSFRDFVGLMTQLITGSTGIAKTVEGAQNAANMEQLNAEVDGENERIITLKINIKEAEKSFAEIETAFNLLVTLLSTPITINVNSIGAISGAAISQTDGNTPPNTNPNGGVSSPLSSHTVQIIWDVQKPDFSQIKEPTIGFDWKQPAAAPGPRTLPTINFRWGGAINDPEYTGPAIKIPIEYVESITEGAGVVAWTGTMNDISGAAFADGSIGRLYSGAQLAGKTLVGELGPELAVYDGQYHLLGQHGAEFVNLPSDAIVFNHRQTEGIARGQFNIRGKAMAEGNITGPAMAGGAAEALAAVRRAKSLWQGLLDSLSAAELTSMGGGGGGGNNLKAIHEDLQEWYNLSRKIANIEQEINNIIAERQNIAAGDGGAYLRSLREEQALLQQQIANQEILQQYQEEQLKRQAEHINNNKIWSQFLQIGPDGLLQYTNGNEKFGGKGALEVLAQLNEMSAQEQINFITSLGYSYTDQNGKQLTGSDLVAKFFEELQLQIDQYDALYDAVHESSEALANLQNNINKINEEIRQNKIDLENSIYDVLVEAWEAEIEALEEQKELIEEANEAYIDGLNDALQAERDMYDQQQSVADRESLQRQLALLRRSGGSASEIADLERQLDDMLKQEYFDSQQKTIENIQDANEKQIKQLERQIQLQEEALTYQKENGVLWAKVAEIMDGSPESILAILQGNSSAFFSASTEQQAKMLEEWAMKVGIYTEDRIYQQHASFAKEKIWDSGDVWNEEGMGEFKDYYAGLDEKDRNTIRDVYAHAYANALLKGEKPEDARKAAAKAASDALKKKQEADKDKKNDDDDDTEDTSNPASPTPTYSKIELKISCSPSKGGTASLSTTSCAPQTTVTVSVSANSGYKFTHITVGGQPKTGLSFTVTGNVNPVSVVAYFEPVDTSTSEEETTAAAKAKVKQDPEATYIAKKYSKGGLVDYTGLAMVHGSPSKPEGFLNAEQTEIISQALTTMGDGGALDGIKRTLAALNANVQSIVNHVSNEVSSFTVAPGAVTIQVEELKDSYDIEKLSNDIMNRMVTIASKSTNRGINRR